MKYILLLLLIVNFAHGAKVNEKLYADKNVTKEIERIRLLISQNIPTAPEIQNQIDIQKLFLSKVETLATKPIKASIRKFIIPKTKTISQKEFIKYFNITANNISNMSRNKQVKEILAKRLTLIKEHLKDLNPDDKNTVLQSQLEYAYFKWKYIRNAAAFEQYQTYLDKEKTRFLNIFKKADVNIKSLEKKENMQNVILQNLYQKKVYLDLRLEKEAILVASKKKVVVDDAKDTKEITKLNSKEKKDKNWKYNFILEELAQVKKNIAKEVKKKNDTLILHQIKNLQSENLDNYIIIRETMRSFKNDLSEEDKKLFDVQQKMLEWVKYEHIGDLTTFYYDFETWISTAYIHSVELVNTPLFYKDDKPIKISNIITMFIIIFIGFMIAKFYKKRIMALQNRVDFIQKQSFKIIGNIGYYIIVIITFAVSLNSIGLDFSSLSLVAGALSVGIGFGLKEVVGNFVSGIILMAERSVKIGDFVEINNETVGNVIDIRMRSVTIKTSSNIDVVVPNSLLVQDTFINYTLDESIRRLSVPFTVAYGVSYERVSELILSALAASEVKYVRDSAEYETEIIITGMDERGVNYTLFVFVDTFGPNARSSFFRLIYKTLQENNLPIPAPKMDVKMI